MGDLLGALAGTKFQRLSDLYLGCLAINTARGVKGSVYQAFVSRRG